MKRWRSVWVARTAARAASCPPSRWSLGTGDPKAPNPVWLGDLEGNGLAEVVFRQSLDDPKRGGIRQEMAEVREPKAGSPSAG